MKSSLGGEISALSESADQMLLLWELHGPFEGINPGVVRQEDTHLETKKMIAEKYQVSHIRSIKQALEEGDLENAYWPPGTGGPADGFTKGPSDIVPHLRLLKSGRFCL